VTDDNTQTSSRKVNFPAVAFLGRCPRCHEGEIFAQSFLGLKNACPTCALDLEPYQQADGPAFFVILIAGAIMTPIALWLARAFQLSGFPYIAVLSVFTGVLVVVLLRFAKAILIASQYKTGAREGRLDQGASHD
jgi:uncharacterized protein (DUF983 family)